MTISDESSLDSVLNQLAVWTVCRGLALVFLTRIMRLGDC